MLDYINTRRGEITQEKLRELDLTPKQMNEYKIAATMKAGKFGIGTWREIAKCFVSFT